MVVLGERVARQHVVVEQAAVVHHARDQLDAVGSRGLEHEPARPRLQRTENDHRPVNQRGVALQAVDQIEREAIRRAGSHAQQAREARLADRLHALPHRGARVADAIGVVQ